MKSTMATKIATMSKEFRTFGRIPPATRSETSSEPAAPVPSVATFALPTVTRRAHLAAPAPRLYVKSARQARSSGKILRIYGRGVPRPRPARLESEIQGLGHQFPVVSGVAERPFGRLRPLEVQV